jgi:PadR family transcriptional regulator, regulatory protein PadR
MAVTELDLVRGTLDLLVLRTLAPAPLHGYAVAGRIRERSEGELLVVEGALYPALHRLEAKGLITAEWGVSATGRRARYYSLTTAGRQRLKTETATWRRYVDAVGKVLAPGSGR